METILAIGGELIADGSRRRASHRRGVGGGD